MAFQIFFRCCVAYCQLLYSKIVPAMRMTVEDVAEAHPFVRIYASSLSSNEISVSAKLTLTTYFPCR